MSEGLAWPGGTWGHQEAEGARLGGDLDDEGDLDEIILEMLVATTTPG